MNTDDFKIPTWTEPETLNYCHSVAANCRFVVESGCYMGASAKAMLEGTECHLWTVDKFEVFGTLEISAMFLGRYIQQGRCEIIQGDMDRAGQMLVHMRGKIDAMFVDDGHAEDDVRRDIRNALLLLRPGGILFGHDYDQTNDVARGVLSMFDLKELTFPVPRVWQWVKPG